MKLKNFSTTTTKGFNGFNKSYSAEKKCAKSILKKLPKGWEIKFNWLQIMFSDVKYAFNPEEKVIEINYNQNLARWWEEVETEILEKINENAK